MFVTSYKMTTTENYALLASANTHLANASRVEGELCREEARKAIACAGEIIKTTPAGCYAARTAISIMEEAQLLSWR